MEHIESELSLLKNKLADLISENKILEGKIELENLKKAIKDEELKNVKLNEELIEKKYSSEIAPLGFMPAHEGKDKHSLNLMNGLSIRHVYKRLDSEWIGVCDGKKIVYNDIQYTPSGFEIAHLKAVASEYRKTFSGNGWKNCEVYYNNRWIKLDDFRKRILMV